MDIANQLVTIFCEIDDFCKEFDTVTAHQRLPAPFAKTARGPKGKLSVSEIMTILVLFQQMRFRTFKMFYCGFLQIYWKTYFPQLPSYTRFIELMANATVPLMVYSQLHSGKRTGIYYIDSTTLPVCHLKRQRRHRTFQGLARFGKTSMGWFFGFKLHLLINDQGQLIAFQFTRGNRHDSQVASTLLNNCPGLAFGDKGYLGQKLAESLRQRGLKLITRGRKNMKKRPDLTPYEAQLLQQRTLVETVIDHLKHHYQVWHTRHRSILNAITHLLAALTAYTLQPLSLSALKRLSKTPN